MWRQRSRVQWLAEGDNNTQYFQKKASARRAKNTITKLQRQDGTVCNESTEMASMASDFYENLYRSEGVQNMDQVINTVPRKVTAEMNTNT